MKEILNTLRKPFTPDRIEWRLQSCGEKQDGSIWAKCLCYIDNRAAQERLDEVFEDGWSSHETFQQIGDKAVCIVEITIHGLADREGQSRSVTGVCAVEANGDIDPFKSAASGAMKRAVVNLGIGRYLYDLPETWAIIDPKGKYDGKTKTGTRFRWNPPGIDAATAASMQESFNQEEIVNSFVKDTAPVKRAAPVSGDDPIIPFGDCKGQPLSSLPMKGSKDKKCGDLYYWAKVYTPKPYNGKISQKDINLKERAEALFAAASGTKPAPVQEDTADEIPF
jgi:hypothetical protein